MLWEQFNPQVTTTRISKLTDTLTPKQDMGVYPLTRIEAE